MFKLVLPFLVLAIDIYALVDVITVQESRVKALNKFAWVLIILVLPLIGAILWFTIGKEHAGSSADRGGRYSAPHTVAPDDDPVFLHNATRFEDQDARIRRLEAELKALNDEKSEE